jgi:malate synthase
MVHIVRPVWEKAGVANQMGRAFGPLTHSADDAAALTLLEPAPRTVRGARDLISVAIQYGNAFERGYQAAALKPADYFADENVLYLMEDMATGEIRLSILWEWLHKRARFTEADAESGVSAGEPFSEPLLLRLIEEEYEKLRYASNRDVHDDSKNTTLPIAREIVECYVLSETKLPWYIDLLNLNLDNLDLGLAVERVDTYAAAFTHDGVRVTQNLDFDR